MKNLKDHIAKNKILELSKILLEFDLTNELENEVINFTSRENELINKTKIGVIDNDHIILERNRINYGFLSIIDRIDSNTVSGNEHKIKLPIVIERYRNDDRIRTTLERIHEKQLSLNERYLPLDFLIDELYNLFDRMTFIREPKIETCRSQRWTARVHTSKMTYEILINFQDNILKNGSEEQIALYGNLLSNIGKYVDSMTGMLFKESKVDIDEVYELIGTAKFLNKFKENIEIRFPNDPNDETIIMDERSKNTINKYLQNTISNIKDLLNSVK